MRLQINFVPNASIQTTDCLEYKINATFYKKKEMFKSHEIKEKNNGIDYFFSFRIPRGKVTFHRYCYFDLRCFECQFRRKMHENIIIMSMYGQSYTCRVL